MRITFNLALFAERPPHLVKIDFAGRRIPLGLKRKDSEKALLWLLESMINIGRIELRRNKLPPLYKAGVVYQREEDTEEWKDPVTVWTDGYGDCEDLSIWRCAELRNNHKKCQPYIRYRVDPETGMYIYHVMVMRANGALEDPSKILGMRGRD